MPGAATVPEPTGRYVDAGGVKLHYHEFGADRPGVPIVCLHGAGPGATAWSNFHGNIDALAERSRTLLVDLPQFGRSEKVVIEGGRQSFSANVLAEFLKALAIPEADFVGNSMGGQIALRLAIDRPDLTHAIVAVGSTPATSVLAPWPAEGVKLINSYYKGAGPSIDKMRRVAEALYSTPRSSPTSWSGNATRPASTQRRSSCSPTIRPSERTSVPAWGRSRRRCCCSGARRTGRGPSTSPSSSCAPFRTQSCTSSRAVATGSRSSVGRSSTTWCWTSSPDGATGQLVDQSSHRGRLDSAGISRGAQPIAFLGPGRPAGPILLTVGRSTF
jgi:pimeloyl-ACP methyl ester carboxylesterase